MNIPSLSRRRTAQDSSRQTVQDSSRRTVQDSNGDGVVDARDEQPVVTDRDADRTTYRSGASATDGEREADVERRAAERGALARAATARSAVDGTRSAAAGRPATVDDGPRTPTDPVRVSDAGPVRTAPRPVDTDRPAGRSRTLPAEPADPDRTTPAAPAGRDRTTTTRPVDPERTTTTRPGDRDRVGADADEVRPEPPVVAGPKPRASLLATLGLIVSVAGALFVLTGTLAGYGIALGALGAVCSVLGLMATRRRHVAGTTDALIGMLVGLAAVVLGVVAFTGQFDWPTTDGDWVARCREWLDSQFANWF
ncbi:thrombospondin [Micromonospora sp. NPDC092111]|uniref:thrombospondin n=1 Tax=Micromonospora sp. NPDC092111 TaxID=3364289 RepID=UPI00380AC7E0